MPALTRSQLRTSEATLSPSSASCANTRARAGCGGALLADEVALDLAVLVVEAGQQLRVELPVACASGRTRRSRAREARAGSASRPRPEGIDHALCPRRTRGRRAPPPGSAPRSPPPARPRRLAAAGGPGAGPPPPSRGPGGSRRGCRRGTHPGRTVRAGAPGGRASLTEMSHGQPLSGRSTAGRRCSVPPVNRRRTFTPKMGRIPGKDNTKRLLRGRRSRSPRAPAWSS